MSDRDAHIRQVQQLTKQIRNSPDPEVRERASELLADKWEDYHNGG